VPDFGLTSAGFVAKRLDEIITDLNAGLVGIFGPNANVDPDSPDGQLIGLFAGAVSEAWETVEEVATIFDPQAASGTLQSKQVRLNGLTRIAESFTLVTAQVVGTSGKTLPAGSVAETSDNGDRFLLQADVVFTGGSDTASFIAEEAGPVPVGASTLTVISTPVNDWTSVTNAAAATFVGSLEESDGDLRRRRERSTELGASSNLSAMQAAIAAVVGVTDSVVLVNETDAADGDGLPEHSYRPIVEGGADDDIAQAMWDNHPMGIATSGAASGNAVDSEGTTHVMNFARPTNVPMHVRMTLSTDSDFPATGEADIAQAIVDWAAGTLAGHEGEKIGIGRDVDYSRLSIPINSVPGHTFTLLLLDDIDPPVTSVNFVVANTGKATFAVADVDFL